MRAKKTEELRPSYAFDYSKAIRGKYHERVLKEGAIVSVLGPSKHSRRPARKAAAR